MTDASDPSSPTDRLPVPLPFGRAALIGMVHLRPLPGTPHWPTVADARAAVRELREAALRDAEALEAAGFDAILVENMHDAPYLRRRVGPEIVASMASVCADVVAAVDCPVGVQVLAGANDAALAIALATGANFVRVEGFVFSAVADEGLLDEADAGPLLRFRRGIGAACIPILADIRKKHTSHALTGDLGIGAWAEAAHFAGADAVIVTGPTTGAAAELAELAAARRSGPLPVGVGSGVTPANVVATLAECDFAIVGSSIKCGGDWRRSVDPDRARTLVEAARRTRT